jgi:ribosomal 50S subunit-recycling heat shock protein
MNYGTKQKGHFNGKGDLMRIDKFLKISRVIKRRTLAHEACERQKVTINGKIAKPGSTVQEGDIVEIRFGENTVRFRVKRIAEHARKEEAGEMIEIL